MIFSRRLFKVIQDIPYETKHPPEMVQDGSTARNLKSNEGGARKLTCYLFG